jgi:hypothetical protein
LKKERGNKMRKLWKFNLLAIAIIAVLAFFTTSQGQGIWNRGEHTIEAIWKLAKNADLRIGKDATITLKSGGQLVMESGSTIAGPVALGNELVQKVYVETGMSSYSHVATNGNIVLIDMLGGATGNEVEKNCKTVYLPPITAALDGYIVTFKSTPSSSTTAAAIISATTGTYYAHGDYLETVAGTVSGNTLRFCTDNSGVSTWMADYVAGSTGYWRLVNKL